MSVTIDVDDCVDDEYVDDGDDEYVDDEYVDGGGY